MGIYLIGLSLRTDAKKRRKKPRVKHRAQNMSQQIMVVQIQHQSSLNHRDLNCTARKRSLDLGGSNLRGHIAVPVLR